jgi:hypothetical protein
MSKVRERGITDGRAWGNLRFLGKLPKKVIETKDLD